MEVVEEEEELFLSLLHLQKEVVVEQEEEGE